jgi:hypothetical protein
VPAKCELVHSPAQNGFPTNAANLTAAGVQQAQNLFTGEGRSRTASPRYTDVEGKRMIRALEAVCVVWVMINVALFVAMKREDAMALGRRTIDRFWRAVGVVRSLPTASAADALIETRGNTEARALGD